MRPIGRSSEVVASQTRFGIVERESVETRKALGHSASRDSLRSSFLRCLCRRGTTESASPFRSPPGQRLISCFNSARPARLPVSPVASLGTDHSGRASAPVGAVPAGRLVCRQRVSEPVPALQWVLETRPRLLRWSLAPAGSARVAGWSGLWRAPLAPDGKTEGARGTAQAWLAVVVL